MKIRIKKLEKLIISGCLNDRKILLSLSQKDINFLLYFAYKNNKFKALNELLPYWKKLDFNKGANLINCLVENFNIKEVTLINKIEDVNISNKFLNFYNNELGMIRESSKSEMKNSMKDLIDVIDYKLKKNFSDRLQTNLSLSEKTKKMVKI